METIEQTVNRVLSTRETTTPTETRRPNLEATAKWAGFQTFNDPQLEEMLAAAWRFMDDYRNDRPARWLVLLGTSEAGKTFMARRLWQWFWDVGRWYVCPTSGANLVRNGQFCSWRRFVGEMLEGDYSRTEDLCSEAFVVLDDVASKRDKSGVATDKLDTILDARRGKWTVITANLSLEEIATQLDVRIASRMVRDGAEVVDVDVPLFSSRSKQRS